MEWVLTLLIVAMVAGLLLSFTRSSGRRQREDDFEQRFGPLG